MTTKWKESDTALYKANKQFGDYFELHSIHIIEEKFNKVLIPRGKYLKFICDNTSTEVNDLKGWDLMFGIYCLDSGALFKKVTFEIKTDKAMFGKTPSPNCFFERTCSNKPSGVFATKSDYFIYIMVKHQKDNFFLAKSQELKELLKPNRYHITRGGEGNRVTGFIMEKDDFMEDFIDAKGKIYTIDFEQDNNVSYEFFDDFNEGLTYNDIKGKD